MKRTPTLLIEFTAVAFIFAATIPCCVQAHGGIGGFHAGGFQAGGAAGLHSSASQIGGFHAGNVSGFHAGAGQVSGFHASGYGHVGYYPHYNPTVGYYHPAARAAAWSAAYGGAFGGRDGYNPCPYPPNQATNSSSTGDGSAAFTNNSAAAQASQAAQKLDAELDSDQQKENDK